jgi:hypothetical protein
MLYGKFTEEQVIKIIKMYNCCSKVYSYKDIADVMGCKYSQVGSLIYCIKVSTKTKYKKYLKFKHMVKWQNCRTDVNNNPIYITSVDRYFPSTTLWNETERKRYGKKVKTINVRGKK